MKICRKHSNAGLSAAIKAMVAVGGSVVRLADSPSPRPATVKMPWGKDAMLAPGRSQRRVRAPGLQGQRSFRAVGGSKIRATPLGIRLRQSDGGQGGGMAGSPKAMLGRQDVGRLGSRPDKCGKRQYAATGAVAGFTMVEIAICLAIIGLALVAIIGVLPLGMNVQRDNREETVINQDATVLMESIRNGVKTGYDLTNYVYAITNYQTFWNASMQPVRMEVFGYGYQGSDLNGVPSRFGINNNARIIGLLSTPEYFSHASLLMPTNNLLGGGYSNHVIAYVRAMSGPAVEKPPQGNPILIEDSFTYRVLAVNAPVATDTNLAVLAAGQNEFSRQLAANLHELRLTFTWPVRPNGVIGSDGPLPQTQRTMVAGTFYVTNDPPQNLFYYQSQTFTNSP